MNMLAFIKFSRGVAVYVFSAWDRTIFHGRSLDVTSHMYCTPFVYQSKYTYFYSVADFLSFMQKVCIFPLYLK